MDDWRDSYPTSIGFHEMCAQFEELSRRILEDGNPVVVDSEAGEVVLISAAEYRSVMETLHIFSNPTNTTRVLQGLQQARNGTRTT